MIALMVGAGALLGAPARYLTDRFVQSRHRSRIPWGTFAVNVVACFGLGALTHAAPQHSAELVAFLGAGLCGTLSTYSTFSFETVRLIETGQRWVAGTYTALSLITGIGAAALGWAVAT